MVIKCNLMVNLLCCCQLLVVKSMGCASPTIMESLLPNPTHCSWSSPLKQRIQGNITIPMKLNFHRKNKNKIGPLSFQKNWLSATCIGKHSHAYFILVLMCPSTQVHVDHLHSWCFLLCLCVLNYMLMPCFTMIPNMCIANYSLVRDLLVVCIGILIGPNCIRTQSHQHTKTKQYLGTL